MSTRFTTSIPLLLLASIPLIHGLLWGLLFACAAFADGSRLLPSDLVRALIAALAVAALSLLASLVTALCALAVATGHRGGWWLGLVAAFSWLFTGCAPLSLLVLGLLWGAAPPPSPPSNER